MKPAGIVINLVGFVIVLAGLGLTDNNMVRLLFCIGGIAVSLAGIIGVLNRAHLAEAVWKTPARKI
jgi:hypothetical protein